MSGPSQHKKASPTTKRNSTDKSLPPSPRLSSEPSGTSSSSKSSSKSRSHELPTVKELMRLLAIEQDTTRDLQHELSLVTSQLAFEQDRADDAERKTKEAVMRFKDANDARLLAQTDVARLTEELKLYKVALQDAQREIFKAQEVLQEVEERRRESEEEAAKLRRKLRKMNEERMFEIAREEGRKQGLREGLEMGKDIGYLRGRNKGHFSGRATADRVMEKYFAAPDEAELRRSRGDLEDDSDPPYTVTTTHFPPSNGEAVPSSSSSNECSRPRSRTRDASTASARTTMYSPARMHVEIPHDGWIPEADSSLLIRLPPPHELVRLPPTPGTRSPVSTNASPSPPLQPIPVPVPAEQSVRMIPEPRSPGNPMSEVAAERRPPKVRRRSSGESVGSSTRTSELDLLNAPEHFTVRGSRSSGLSAIPEVASFQESLTPSNDSSRQSTEDRVDEAGFVHVSMPTPRTPAEAASFKASSSPSQCLSVDQIGHSRPASSSSFGTVNITVQPPSRPSSNNSQSTTSGTRPHLLSPADADRPIPLPSHTPVMVPPPTGSTTPISLPDGRLPPGFVPTGPPTPLTHASSETRYSGANGPLLPSTVGSYHHRLPSHVTYSGSTVAAPLPGGGSAKSDGDTPVVIPPPLEKFARREESDDSSSDADSITSPPPRYRVPSSTGYTEGRVPLPPSGYTATGITLPPSSTSGTPYSYTRSPGVDALYTSMNANAGVTPAALGRVKSFSTDRGTSVRG
ncbi:hypothetical protein ID866_1073 [Astraeus odoratus]|nr:hypothetical protein ID866_1073 [Astraeus odoratus]